MRKTGICLGLLILLLLCAATAVWADDPGHSAGSHEWNFDDGKTYFNEDVSIEKGEVVDGDLGILNGNLALAEGSVVNGDLFILNGDVVSEGQVNGNLAVIKGDLVVAQTGWVTGDVFGLGGTWEIAGHVSGDIAGLLGKTTLRSTAVVGGDLLGDLVQEEGAQIGGQVERIPSLSLPFLSQRRDGEPETPAQRIGRFVGRIVAAIMMILVLLFAGVLIAIIWPRPTQRVAGCIAGLPLRSLGVGLLALLGAAALEVLAVILLALIVVVAAALMATVVLIPVGLALIVLGVLLLAVVPLALAAGMLFGWVALAGWVGQKVLAALKAQKIRPVAAVVVGLLATGWLPAVLWLIEPCCLAWPVVILITSLGLGAVILTRFGTRRGLPTTPPAAPVAADTLPAGSPPPVLPAQGMDQEVGQPDGPPAAQG